MAERLLVIGGDAGGMAAATQARRRNPKLDIVAVERGRYTSYSACGIPYLVGGAVGEIDDLVVRTPKEFQEQHRINVRMRTEAMAIDLDAGKVEVRDHERDRTVLLGYDHLMIGTGARPIRPELPGIDLDFVHGVQTLDDAERLLARAEASECRDVVVVGSGYIGLEMAEAFIERHAKVTVVEAADQVMGTLDADMATLVAEAMRERGIDLRLGCEVSAIEPGLVRCGDERIRADLVVLGLGVRPNSELAGEAGIDVGVRGAIRVSRRQETSAERVWAAGDCCESFHLISRKPVYVALGTVANRQARVAGTNIAGGYATFEGVLGTAVTKICATEVARTGLTEAEAAAVDLRVVTGSVESTTAAGYYPGHRPVTVKVVAERGSGRLLGAQIVGGPGSAKRIDVVVTALSAGMDANTLADLDFGYAPPFGPVWDPIALAARHAAAAAREPVPGQG